MFPFILMFIFGCIMTVAVLKFRTMKNLDTVQTVILFFLGMSVCGGLTYFIAM